MLKGIWATEVPGKILNWYWYVSYMFSIFWHCTVYIHRCYYKHYSKRIKSGGWNRVTSITYAYLVYKFYLNISVFSVSLYFLFFILFMTYIMDDILLSIKIIYIYMYLYYIYLKVLHFPLSTRGRYIFFLNISLFTWK